MKQALVLGALVAGAFGVAKLLNDRRRKRKPRTISGLEDLEQLEDAELVLELER